MRQYIFAISNVLLTGMLLFPAAGRCADMAVGGAPNTYNSVPSVNAIQRLSDQYRSGAINFSQYQQGLAQMAHPIKIVSDITSPLSTSINAASAMQSPVRTAPSRPIDPG